MLHRPPKVNTPSPQDWQLQPAHYMELFFPSPSEWAPGEALAFMLRITHLGFFPEFYEALTWILSENVHIVN